MLSNSVLEQISLRRSIRRTVVPLCRHFSRRLFLRLCRLLPAQGIDSSRFRVAACTSRSSGHQVGKAIRAFPAQLFSQLRPPKSGLLFGLSTNGAQSRTLFVRASDSANLPESALPIQSPNWKSLRPESKFWD